MKTTNCIGDQNSNSSPTYSTAKPAARIKPKSQSFGNSDNLGDSPQAEDSEHHIYDFEPEEYWIFDDEGNLLRKTTNIYGAVEFARTFQGGCGVPCKVMAVSSVPVEFIEPPPAELGLSVEVFVIVDKDGRHVETMLSQQAADNYCKIVNKHCGDGTATSFRRTVSV